MFVVCGRKLCRWCDERRAMRQFICEGMSADGHVAFGRALQGEDLAKWGHTHSRPTGAPVEFTGNLDEGFKGGTFVGPPQPRIFSSQSIIIRISIRMHVQNVCQQFP